ncbi:APC family permease [Sinomonas gamaensis]|uniref:APC family permease n=1 Tax=Sinomonas gamaensis TaxID=2565624 RepID=UPI001107FBFA|nr:amino acid permease [Sinomonas gamaensis]
MTTPDLTPASSELKREFTLWSSFAFAFAFISPIVALYGIFSLAIQAAGPSFWWGFPLVFGGQLLVAFVFALLASRWPVEGSIYQWSRRLLGERYGWFAGWIYMWTLVSAMATVALGCAGFIANILGLTLDPVGSAGVASLVLLAATGLNLIGRKPLKIFMTASICAEILGSIGLGTWLLLFHPSNSITVLASAGGPDYFSISGPFVTSVAFIGFAFVGFESAGAIAEEVQDAGRTVPKAIIRSLTIVALVVMFSALAIILAIPDLGAVAAGDVADPVFGTLTAALGQGIARPVEVLFLIGFFASCLALQTSASRVLWSYARDRAVPGWDRLQRLSGSQREPMYALVTTTVVGLVLLLLSFVATDVYTIMVNFTTGGFYLAFLFPILGFLAVRLWGRWVPGPFSGGRLVPLLSVLAAVWTIASFVNISWPREASGAWYLNWSVIIGIVVVSLIGVMAYRSVRLRIRKADVVEGNHDPQPEVSR